MNGRSAIADSTVFVQWDDWGGLYDPVPPPFKDYDGLGFRVPMIAISAYAKHNYVSHAQYETASVLRFAARDFNSYGARRGNHEVMVRGTFANVRLRNALVPEIEGGVVAEGVPGPQMSPTKPVPK